MIKSEFALLPYMFLLVISSFSFIADTQYLLSLPCRGSWARAWVQVIWKSGLCKVMIGFKETFLTLFFPWGALPSPVLACAVQLAMSVPLKTLFLKKGNSKIQLGGWKVDEACKRAE